MAVRANAETYSSEVVEPDDTWFDYEYERELHMALTAVRQVSESLPYSVEVEAARWLADSYDVDGVDYDDEGSSALAA
jgi:hypothetical protein